MSTIETYPIIHNSVLSIYADRDRIQIDPEYQRQGEVWSLEKRQLLVDSIINRYDIPKLYFHKLNRSNSMQTGKEYAVIDGKQRLEAIFGFIENEFPLSADFEYLEDPNLDATGLTYNDLAKKYPKLKQRFDSFTLPIMSIVAEDIELIEDLFSRLNEAVPLNSAEKRNAIGGDMADAFKDISFSHFFTKKIRFGNKRYQHREVAARLLFLEHSSQKKRLIDTKKPFLDQFTRDFKSNKKSTVKKLKDRVLEILKIMNRLFVGKDILLAAQSGISIYYLLVRDADTSGKLNKLTREKLMEFHRKRQANRELASKDITKANFEFLEYDRLSQQGTNDASSIRERLRIIKEFLKV